MTNRLDFLTKDSLKATLGYLREQVYTLSSFTRMRICEAFMMKTFFQYNINSFKEHISDVCMSCYHVDVY